MNISYLRAACFGVLLALFCASATAVDDDKIMLNFVNADIESVVKAIGQITNKNFLMDPRVKGTITITSANPIPSALAYQVLLSALRTQGFTAIEGNGMTTILPEADAKMHFSGTYGANSKVGGDQIITQVFPLKYESATLLVPILKPLISPNNIINAYPSNNTLIITDYAENLKKVSKLISTIDKPSTAENVVVKLQYANAIEIAQTLTKLTADVSAGGASGATAEPSRRIIAVPDARSNSVILRSENDGLISRAKELITQLDTPMNSGNSIHVVYLRNADAKKLAATLQALMNGASDSLAAFGNPGNSSSNQATASVTNQPVTNIITPVGYQPGYQPTLSAMPSGTLSGSPFSGNVPVAPTNGMIQADSATNSLIITAPDNVYNMLRGVVDKLDIRRAQLYIEALVAEISTDKASEFGIQWQDLSNLNANTSGNVRGFGGTKFNTNGASINSVAQNVNNASNGLNIGIIRGQINVPGLGVISNLGLLAHALESDVNANILSKPNLLTLDNEEAKIVIGQNVPFITGQYAQTGGAATVSPFQTIERRDVGLTLRVKPQISESKTIKLQIYQEVSSVADNSNNAGITTNKRSIDTSVMVDDGSIIVLGGLIEDRVTQTLTKVPLLGDIPGLGNLFKTQGRGHKKTNLMVFLRPYVMRDDNATDAITNDRYDYIRNQQQAVTPKPHWVLPDVPEVALPEDRNSFELPKAPAKATEKK
ncbi:MAG TPA: type II secretion system secretin GspD [Methylophilaceae bacterium]|nr:type II secretion system secretin GspD [Methylophilaceae bacterium]